MKRIVIYILIIATLIITCGCSSQVDRETFTYSSRVYANIYVTNSQKEVNSYIEILTYRIVIGDDSANDTLPEDKTYYIGKDAILDGEGTEQFDNCEVQIRRFDNVEKMKSDDFLQSIVNTIAQKKFIINEKEIKALEKQVKRELDYIANNSTIYMINLRINFRPTSNAIIKNITVPEIDFTFEYDNFVINYDEERDLKNGKQSEELSDYLFTTELAYKYSPYEASLFGFEVCTNEDTDKVDIKIVDDNFTIFTKDNSSKYEDYINDSTILYDDKITYYKGNEFYEEIGYAFNENISSNYESIYVPILVTLHKNEKSFSKYLISPNIVGWEWFVYSYVSSTLK